MKKTFIALSVFMLIFGATSAQDLNQKKKPESSYANFVYLTPQMDTLFLAEDNPLTTLTLRAWSSDPKWSGNNPYLIVIPQTEIDRKKRISPDPKTSDKKRN